MNEIMTTNPAAVMPVLSIQEAVQRYNAVVEFTRGVMKEGKDFGTIPGAGDKPTLLKPGAEKLCSLFGMVPDFITMPETVIDWAAPFFYLRVKCELRRGGALVGTGIGSANSHEIKYRYRQAKRVCPKCGKPSVKKGKEEFGGGWYCDARDGGCRAKFAEKDPQITEQQTGQVENPDPADLLNTLDKMAQKRALVAATLIAANASEFFTQDIEDMGYINGEFTAAPVQEMPKVQPVKNTMTPGVIDAEDLRMDGATFDPPPAQPVRPQPSKAKTLPQLIVEAGLSDSVPAAANLANKLKLAGMIEDKAIERARLYRAWRDSGADSDAAAENAIAGASLP